MKKLLTVALVFVFALALVFALGCNKKEEAPATEGGATSGMESTTPMATDSMATMAPTDSTAAAPTK
jgi:uncharacterized lipoprotein YehR (DUF1307 family)